MDPDPITSTPHMMVLYMICSRQASGATGSLLDHLEPQPILETEAELPVLKVETKGVGGDDIQPITSIRDSRGEG